MNSEMNRQPSGKRDPAKTKNPHGADNRMADIPLVYYIILCPVDFQKAFDSVDRQTIWNILRIMVYLRKWSKSST